MYKKIKLTGKQEFVEVELEAKQWDFVLGEIERTDAYHRFYTTQGDNRIVVINDIDEFPCVHALVFEIERYDGSTEIYLQASPAFLEYLIKLIL